MSCNDEERREVARLLRAVKPIWCDISDPMCMLCPNGCMYYEPIKRAEGLHFKEEKK